MDVRRLRYFVTTYEEGSITQAANVSGVAQSAVSQQLALLERELKTSLFLRQAQGVTPTRAGHLLYRRAQNLLRDLDDLSRMAQQPNLDRDIVAIGLPAITISALGTQLLREVKARDSDILLQVYEDRSQALAEHVESGRLAFAVVSHHTIGNLDHSLVCNEHIDYVAPASWHLPSEISLADLAAVPLVLPYRTHSLRTIIDAAFAREGVEPMVSVESDSLELLGSAVASGLGATLLPSHLFAQRWSDAVQTRKLKRGIMRTLMLCLPKRPRWRPSEELVYQTLKDLLILNTSR